MKLLPERFYINKIYFVMLILLNIMAICLPSDPAIAQSDPCASSANSIVAENCQTGTDTWHITHFLGDINGFTSQTSVNPGDQLDFYVDSGGQNFDLIIFRSGYYSGLGGRLILSVPNISNEYQPACYKGRSTGLYSCSNWTSSYQLKIPDDWVSGVYLAKLVNLTTEGENYIPFVIRNDDRKGDIAFQLSVTTYQAYNNYGGKSLYSSGCWDYCPTESDAARAVKVSFDRPNVNPIYMQNTYFWTDYPMVYWLESQGYDLNYLTNLDTHQYGKSGGKNGLLGFKAFLSVGHDEYWTQEMRNAITQARDAGVHIGFFSSNVGYWRVRLEPDPWSGDPDRVMVCYKTTESGAKDPSGVATTTWRDPAGVNDPENSLVGIQYVGDNDNIYFPLRISSEQGKDHLFRHTFLQELPSGTYIDIGKHLIGWEWDAVVDNGKMPKNLVVLSASPVYGEFLTDTGRHYIYQSGFMNVTRYVASSGSIVFATGTNQWSWGLAIYEPNLLIQQITINLLSDMGVYPMTPSSDLFVDGNPKEEFVINPTVANMEKYTDPSILLAIENLIREWFGVQDFIIPIEKPYKSISSLEETSLREDDRPRITDVQVLPFLDEAIISWKTDRPANGHIWVKMRSGEVDWRVAGESPGVRPIISEAAHESNTQNHELVLKGLQPGRKYYFQIASMDKRGNITVQDELSFRTRTGALLPQVKNWLRPIFRQARCYYLANKFLTVMIVCVLFVLIFITAYKNKRRFHLGELFKR